MTHVSLFSGIGGIDLAAEWAGFKTVLFCEKDPYCQKVLARHWPGVPIIDDIRSVTSESFSGAVDVISGGFPCQPFSHAGKRGGTTDDRYLWPEMLRVIRELKPRWVVAENVPGLLSIERGVVFETVLSDLEAAGYETLPFVYPACGVGANHRRNRVFIVAHRKDLGYVQPSIDGRDETGPDAAERGDVAGSSEFGRGQGRNRRLDSSGAREPEQPFQDVADPESSGLEIAEGCERSRGKPELSRPERDGLHGGRPTGNWSIEPDVGRVAHEFSRGMDGGRQMTQTHDIEGLEVISYADAKKKGTAESLQSLRERIGEESFREWEAGRPLCLHETKILQSLMHGGGHGERRANVGSSSEKTPEVSRDEVPAMWGDRETSGTPQEPEPGGQCEGKHYDPLRAMPHEVALGTWEIEPPIPRVAASVKNRVNRLKALGNAVVPAQAYPIFRAIAQVEKGEKP